MKLVSSTVVGGCGVGKSYNFGYGWDNHISESSGGAGYHMACFIVGDEKCDILYEEYKKRWPIAFQSETRLNRNSGNQFYFCVYDVKASGETYAGYRSDDEVVTDDDNDF